MTRQRKINYIIIAAVILSINAYFDIRFINNYRMYGSFFKPRYGEITKAGNLIVKAIYTYKNDTGLSPRRLEDLVAQYCKEIPIPELMKELEKSNKGESEWNYWSDYTSGFKLTYAMKGLNKSPKNLINVFYRDDCRKAGWNAAEFINNLYSMRRIHFVKVPVYKCALNREELANRKLAELDKRIKKMRDLDEKLERIKEEMRNVQDKSQRAINEEIYSKSSYAARYNADYDIEHFKAKISLLVNRRRLKEARQACFECIEMFEDSPWPYVAVAKIDKLSGSPGASEFEIKSPHDKNIFSNPYHLFCYCRERANKGKAISFIEESLNPEKINYSFTELELFDMALYAYRMKKLDMALEICDIFNQSGYSQKGFISIIPPALFEFIRAACYLSKEEIEKARSTILQVVQMSKKINFGKPLRSQEDINNLLYAMEKRDKNFVFMAHYKPDFYYDFSPTIDGKRTGEFFCEPQ